MRRAGAHDRAKRPHDPALPADHLADVVRRDMKPDHRGVVALHCLDTDRVRRVHETPRDPRDQLGHRRGQLDYPLMPAALISRDTASLGWAPLASQSFTFASSRSIVEG